MNNFYIELQGETYSITLHRSLRRSISLEVIGKYLIEARAPLFIDIETIKDFILKKEKWLSSSNRRLLKFTGIIPDKLSNPIYILENPFIIGVDIPITSPINYKIEVEKWLKKYGKELIQNEVIIKAREIGVEYNRIFIKSQKTRWGSCSGKRNLNFNWRIILTTRGCLKYLVVHELCHLLEMNHSGKFWTLVKRFDPDYLKHRRSLREYSPLLRL